MCKNGFCRKDGKCVKRDCEHPFFKSKNDGIVEIFDNNKMVNATR
jgi:hypothetical protein